MPHDQIRCANFLPPKMHKQAITVNKVAIGGGVKSKSTRILDLVKSTFALHELHKWKYFIKMDLDIW